ncbi:MAG: XdhC family protein [Anaerolineae bacterium]|nr:MAG: XdhC family protein [Anaerolineae bacterium]
MRDILEDLTKWTKQGTAIALATVVQTWGSSPRQEGAKMAISERGEIAGSVSGGCVESAVAEAGLQVIKSGSPQLLHFGVADETAWSVGLACGGSLDVFVERLDPKQFEFVRALLIKDEPAASVTIVKGPERIVGRKITLSMSDPSARYGSLDSGSDDPSVELALQVAESSLHELEPAGLQAFVDLIPPPPTLVVVGGNQIAITLSRLAKTMDMRTVIVDPRRAFATEERFPEVDQLLQAWPAEAFEVVPLTAATAVVMLTHDPKIDEPALELALPSPAFYVGALGSKRTQAKRRERLKEHGLSEVDLDRLHGPVGMDLGADTPDEIALSIMAEIVAVRHRAEG